MSNKIEMSEKWQEWIKMHSAWLEEEAEFLARPQISPAHRKIPSRTGIRRWVWQCSAWVFTYGFLIALFTFAHLLWLNRVLPEPAKGAPAFSLPLFSDSDPLDFPGSFIEAAR